MIALWLQAALILGLALAAWIAGMDANANPTETMLLWALAASGGVLFALRLRTRER